MLRILVLACIIACVRGASVQRRGLVPMPTSRIIGGVETSIEKHPHQASFRMYGSHRCGGSIFKADVIISTAHCVDGYPTRYLTVVAGTTDWKAEGVSRQVKDYVFHEDYDTWTIEKDISLIYLDSGFDFSSSIQPISLASEGETLRAGTKATVTGWGTLVEDGPLSDILQAVEVTIVDFAACKKAYDGINEVTESMFCAGEPQGGLDACQGDSGGPLTVGGKLYGIVSWGYGCAKPDYPGVYVKVSTLREWISSKLDT